MGAKELQDLINRQNTLESFVHSKFNIRGQSEFEVTKNLIARGEEEDTAPVDDLNLDETKPFTYPARNPSK